MPLLTYLTNKIKIISDREGKKAGELVQGKTVSRELLMVGGRWIVDEKTGV